MKKIMILILLVVLFSCEEETPFEEGRKINPEEIDWGYFRRNLWCINDSTSHNE
jgi:hypothetical protein